MLILDAPNNAISGNEPSSEMFKSQNKKRNEPKQVIQTS